MQMRAGRQRGARLSCTVVHFHEKVHTETLVMQKLYVKLENTALILNGL